ncbi:putative fatty acyl-CoA reductase [Corchorus olitorius]|uniref:Fatty acyl-CoA reductase n=1 Tax=Corchorus olitorius TaxID=93759 RepID=A0A1R3GZR2_9ROSI|nr:putative fatty acyl-CoA reductase [Corchorus olitorius]
MAAGKRKIIERRKKDRPMKKKKIDLKEEMEIIKLYSGLLTAFRAVQAKLIEENSFSASPNRDRLIRNVNLMVKQLNMIGEDYIDEMQLKLTAHEVNNGN